MNGASRVPRGQEGPRYEEVERRLRRHRARRFERPLDESVAARLEASFGTDSPSNVILDAGCGTGRSTLVLARRHPHARVIGIDKSGHRLGRGPGSRSPVPANACWLQANMIDVWQIALARGWRFAALVLAYPNPYPKAGDLGRRWHGHPVFPALVATAHQIELRSNWRIYLEEFAHAVKIFTGRRAPIEALSVDEPLSPFEAKYAASGHALWRWDCRLGDRGEFATSTEAS